MQQRRYPSAFVQRTVIDADRERFAGELVDYVEQLQTAPSGGLVEAEIQRSHVIGVLGAQSRCRTP